MILRAFQIEDENAVIDLWTRCGLVKSHNDPRKDIARKLKVNPKMFLVGLLEAKIIATVMVGYEGHRGWINYLAVSPECRMRGLGKRMMDEAERLLRREGCPKINLQVRTSNTEVLAFYKSIGFLQDDAISLRKRLEHDESPT